MIRLYLNGQVADAASVCCGNCDWRGIAKQTGSIADAQERLDPGSVVPVGECPKCRSLTYLDPPPEWAFTCRAPKELLTFEVNVSRSLIQYRNITVQAENAADASELALDRANELDFSCTETDPKYAGNGVLRPVKGPPVDSP